MLRLCLLQIPELILSLVQAGFLDVAKLGQVKIHDALVTALVERIDWWGVNAKRSGNRVHLMYLPLLADPAQFFSASREDFMNNPIGIDLRTLESAYVYMQTLASHPCHCHHYCYRCCHAETTLKTSPFIIAAFADSNPNPNLTKKKTEENDKVEEHCLHHQEALFLLLPFTLVLNPSISKKTCPLLLQVFAKIRSHHSMEDFVIRGKEPKDEVQIYT
ncbi:hypothetical protein JHK84_040320 [Glycine max]|nr:hypothetical protein JHK84_040320 [Glycine max]